MMINYKNIISILLSVKLVLLFSCKKDDDFHYNPDDDDDVLVEITTDLCRYDPGQEVVFSVDAVPADVMIRYKFLGGVIGEENLTANTWTWSPPTGDFKGYMVELYRTVDGMEENVGTVGVDVSSDWARFPRYGFLSAFGDITSDQTNGVINNLKDYHINGLQYYDW
nr:cycloisomaltooligosaccharide glucanotransferase [Bacteroidota bacterium]